ncbi:YfbR-like 5'-deoxynucleotidase [Escherichia coli]|uniref:YfbR-like 5'-deoxynucleotidase n=1 Tax=Escherichia coli TaxID=562 RepID=UPI00098B463E|nr:YfbR-like 5'-deoxynucleotidase [Escherichia coli]
MSFIKTFSGKHFYYDKINKDDIVINDIAVSLSNICRFAGHLSHFYSVAQHAVLCSQLVPQEFAFEALMHDATEAYCQDIPAPLKRLLPDYKRMGKKYGRLNKDTWRDDLRQGFKEAFRVLWPNGVLVFKWNETQIPVSQILALTDRKPVIGQRTGKNDKTHWIIFMKEATSE